MQIHIRFMHDIDIQKCMIWIKAYPTKMKAMAHVKAWHTDLYLKFDKTTVGIIEPLDILSIPEDQISTLLSG